MDPILAFKYIFHQSKKMHSLFFLLKYFCCKESRGDIRKNETQQ